MAKDLDELGEKVRGSVTTVGRVEGEKKNTKRKLNSIAVFAFYQLVTTSERAGEKKGKKEKKNLTCHQGWHLSGAGKLSDRRERGTCSRASPSLDLEKGGKKEVKKGRFYEKFNCVRTSINPLVMGENMGWL